MFEDGRGDILYVGKAKLLRARVRSYFRLSKNLPPATYPPKHGLRLRGSRSRSGPAGLAGPLQPHPDLDPAKQEMVKKVRRFKTITTDNELEALVLEATLIRKHQPPYNVVLRDDKYYLFIKITTGEEIPRVFLTRRINKDKACYFGPYSSARSVRASLRLLRRIFPHRGEKDSAHDIIFPHPLFSIKENVIGEQPLTAASARDSEADPPLPRMAGLRKGKGRQRAPRPAKPWRSGEAEALEHASLGHAKKETRHAVSPDNQYRDNIQNIIRFLQGKRDHVIATLRDGMEKAARANNFEQAAIFRDQVQAIERLDDSQKVFLPKEESFDVVSIARARNQSAGNIFQIRQGQLINKNTFLLRHRAVATAEDTLRQFLLQYYQVAQNIPPVILIPFAIADHEVIANWMNKHKPPVLATPQRGKKFQLVKMGETNARQLLDDQAARFETKHHAQEAMQELFHAVGVPAPTASSRRVEIYDVSNIQGQLATASMVVFIDGQADPAKYRKFRIKIAGQPDDYKMIREVLSRRFSTKHTAPASRGAPAWPLPDLIVIDGGKGQLSSAKRVLDELKIIAPVIAIAKREEEIFAVGNPKPIRLPYDSRALYLIQRMRDEAHRFTVTYHRLLRSQRQRHSILDEVPGIGPKTKKRLLNRYGSLKEIRSAGDEELRAVIGREKTKALRDYL